jgi:hypothetical protein
MLLIHRYEHRPDPASGRAASRDSVQCGLDVGRHILPDGNGGCIPPPPDGGYIIDVPIPEGAVIEKYPVKRVLPAEELERTCPWKAPLSEARQNLFILPNRVSCVGKPFNICIGGEKR